MGTPVIGANVGPLPPHYVTIAHEGAKPAASRVTHDLLDDVR